MSRFGDRLPIFEAKRIARGFVPGPSSEDAKEQAGVAWIR